ncbi:MAG: hypothetical protein WC501_02170 [Candidatus Micrarchaeia archaeon]
MKNKIPFILCIIFGIIIFFGCTAQEKQENNSSAIFIDENAAPVNNNLSSYVNNGSAAENKAEENPGGEEIIVRAEKIEAIIPVGIENNCIGFLSGALDEMENIRLIGGGWARPHPGPFVWDYIEKIEGAYDFSYPDEYVMAAQEKNISILATVWPFAEWDQKSDSSCKVSDNDIFNYRGKDEFDGLPKYRCKPKDMQAYKNFLEALTERYDGDGINDMPGLVIPVKYYEILNEPEMKSDELTFFVGDENDYFEILKGSYETIKETCPDCKVLHAGCAGSQEEFLFFWKKVFGLGGGSYFDIANIHYIGSGDLNTLNVKSFKNILIENNLEKPIWVTEVEFDNENSDVVEMSRGAFNAGAAKLFYVSFEVGGHGPSEIGKYSSKYVQATALCKK